MNGGLHQIPGEITGSASFFCSMPLPRAGAGMCARRRSNFLLRRQEKVTKEKATPLSVSPALRFGATSGARFRRGPRKLASLKQRAALIRLKLCSSARSEGIGVQQPFGPSLRSALVMGAAQVARAAQALGSDHDFAQRNSCSDPNPGMVSAAAGGDCTLAPPLPVKRLRDVVNKSFFVHVFTALRPAAGSAR